MSRFRSLPWWLVLIVPAFELTAHAWITAHVPPDSDYRAAADFVRSQLRPRDLIASAPEYTDPLLRRELGDLMPLAMAGRSDDSAYERLWVLSIRDALPPEAPTGEPELARTFGRVRVLRYPLGRSPMLLDLVQALPSAEVTLMVGGVPRRCPRRTGGVPRGGGLGRPVLMPIAERFECDVRRPWLFVGSIVMEDLDQRPRHCVWQHAQGPEPISVRFGDVPLGDELVFDGGIYYEHERMRTGGPVEIDIFIDGRPRGRMIHRDGEGWKRQLIPTGTGAAERGEIRIDVRAQDPGQRSFCWAASTRRRENGASP
jgi:hypothetical protein